MKAAAIILASGVGQRFGDSPLPKHLTSILGIPIIVWTLENIIKSKLFSSITIVTKKENLSSTEKILKEYFLSSMGNINLTRGSSSRMQSFLFGLDYLTKNNSVSDQTIISLIDANRPFTPKDQLKNLYNTALDFKCSCPARPIINGIARINSHRILEVPEKSSFFEFFTPEFIQFKTLKSSLDNSKKKYKSLVEYALASKIHPMIIDACTLNAKLTFPEDQTYLEGLAIESKLVKPFK
jgi:D-ribitol-5-phosphate cytidylyltransferase